MTAESEFEPAAKSTRGRKKKKTPTYLLPETACFLQSRQADYYIVQTRRPGVQIRRYFDILHFEHIEVDSNDRSDFNLQL